MSLVTRLVYNGIVDEGSGHTVVAMVTLVVLTNVTGTIDKHLSLW